MSSLKPFWRYYGGKYRAAPKYPSPVHDTIIEPFAGAAGYSLRHFQRKVILVEKYHEIAETWRYLISASAKEILRLPLVDHIDDLPGWVPEGARYLVGFNLSSATITPKRQLSAGIKRMHEMGRTMGGWREGQRERVAKQVKSIKHWRVLEGDYSEAPDIEATWFVDPPYNNHAGSLYVHSEINYVELGAWCGTRSGQVIVCENEGADWLPFIPFRKQRSSMTGKTTVEMIYTNN